MSLDGYIEHEKQVKRRTLINEYGFKEYCEGCRGVVHVEKHPNGSITVHCGFETCEGSK